TQAFQCAGQDALRGGDGRVGVLHQRVMAAQVVQPGKTVDQHVALVIDAEATGGGQVHRAVDVKVALGDAGAVVVIHRQPGIAARGSDGGADVDAVLGFQGKCAVAAPVRVVVYGDVASAASSAHGCALDDEVAVI